MKTETKLIYDRIHDIQQRLEQRFEATGKDETEPFYKHRFVAELMEEVQLIAQKDQHICHSHKGESTAYIDRHLVKNVLLNLLSNAIKYSAEGEDIELITKRVNGLFTIQVKDRGIGIPEEEQERIFGRFFRASNAVNIKGSGLGLTIVKRYLELMDGTITFTSNPQGGTVFKVKIPQP